MRLSWRGLKVKKVTEDAAADGVFEAAHFFLDEMNKIVPHDEGTLERSGTVATKLPNGNTVYAAAEKGKDMQNAYPGKAPKMYISYNTPYAIRLHEHPEYNFQDGREGEWVDKIIKKKRLKKKANKHIAKKIRKALR